MALEFELDSSCITRACTRYGVASATTLGHLLHGREDGSQTQIRNGKINSILRNSVLSLVVYLQMSLQATRRCANRARVIFPLSSYFSSWLVVWERMRDLKASDKPQYIVVCGQTCSGQQEQGNKTFPPRVASRVTTFCFRCARLCLPWYTHSTSKSFTCWRIESPPYPIHSYLFPIITWDVTWCQLCQSFKSLSLFLGLCGSEGCLTNHCANCDICSASTFKGDTSEMSRDWWRQHFFGKTIFHQNPRYYIPLERKFDAL